MRACIRRKSEVVLISAEIDYSMIFDVLSWQSEEFVARNAGGGILNGQLILAGTHLYMLMATFPWTEEWR